MTTAKRWTFDEAEFVARDLEVVLVEGTPEGDVWCAVLRGSQAPENGPIDWFVNTGDGSPRLVVGDGATPTEARLWAAGRIVDSDGWHPGMSLREAERALYPGLSAMDEEDRHRRAHVDVGTGRAARSVKVEAEETP